MFLGHYAVGLAAKSAKPAISLGVYFLAAQFVDLLWATLLFTGVEVVVISPGITRATPLDFVHYPVTHSLVMAIIWSAIGFVIYFQFKRDRMGAFIIAGCVVSHWFLDFISHRPDLPLDLAESTRVGLGLWNYKWLSAILEIALFIGGLILYLRARHKPKRTFAFWSLMVVLFVIYVSSLFGSAPPSVEAVAWSGNLQWVFVFWAGWVDYE